MAQEGAREGFAIPSDAGRGGLGCGWPAGVVERQDLEAQAEAGRGAGEGLGDRAGDAGDAAGLSIEVRGDEEERSA
jgi:hypothetical protein